MKALLRISTCNDSVRWTEHPYLHHIDVFMREVGAFFCHRDIILLTDNPDIANHCSPATDQVSIGHSESLTEHVAQAVREWGLADDETVLALDHHNLLLGRDELEQFLLRYRDTGKPVVGTKSIHGITQQFVQHRRILATESIHLFDEAVSQETYAAHHKVTQPFRFFWDQHLGTDSATSTYRQMVSRQGVTYHSCAVDSPQARRGGLFVREADDAARILYPSEAVPDIDGASPPGLDGRPEFTVRFEGVLARFALHNPRPLGARTVLEVAPFDDSGLRVGDHVILNLVDGVATGCFSVPWADIRGFVVMVSEPVREGVANTSTRFTTDNEFWSLDREGQYRKKDDGVTIIGRQQAVPLMEVTGDIMVGKIDELVRIAEFIDSGKVVFFQLPQWHCQVHSRFDYLKFKAADRFRREDASNV
jgi:hypothetical protein